MLFLGLHSILCLKPIGFSLLLFNLCEKEFLCLGALTVSAVSGSIGAIVRGKSSAGRDSALSKQAIRLALEAHVYAKLNKL